MASGGIALQAQEQQDDRFEARRRRPRSTKRNNGNATTGSSQQPWSLEEEVGGEGEEASSVYSSSAASSSARYRHSLRKRREKQQRGTLLETERCEGQDDNQVTAANSPVVVEGEDNVAGSSLDDTTARITSLLQRIDNETQQPPPLNDDRGESHSPSPSSPLPAQPSTLALTVHKTDRLRPDLTITHPLVRVCLVSCESGELVKKPCPDRRVTSYYEAGVDHILPVLTQPWLKQGQSFHPRWEETLLFNEDLSLFLSDQTLLLFELLDFPTPSSHSPHTHWTSRQQQQQQQQSSGGDSWLRIAWAFLRAGGGGVRERVSVGDGELSEVWEGDRRNIGRACRLQLYCYPKHRRRRASSSISEVWELWHGYKRKPYPSTLYVTLNETTPTEPQATPPTTRSMHPSQPEVGLESVEQMMDRLHGHTQNNAQEPAKKLVDVPPRLPGHTCHLPTSLHSHPHPPHNASGSSTVSFSPDGNYLGAGYITTGHGENHILVVYEVTTMSVSLWSDAHQGFIYSLSWSHDSHMISTASADGIVKVWSVPSGDEVASLPHPCYMYATCFIPHPSPITPHHLTLLTGGYDKIIRVWSLTPSRIQLSQELRGHRGHVNAICVASSGQVVYSGDSVGDVRVWSVTESEQTTMWHLQRTITTQKTPVAILSLCLHPGGNKLLLHTTAGRLTMLDLRVGHECCGYGVLHCRGERGSSLVTPCGMMVVGGCGEGEVKVWTCDSGELLHSFSLPEPGPVSSLSHHPSLHLLAASSLLSHQPLSLLTHQQ